MPAIFIIKSLETDGTKGIQAIPFDSIISVKSVVKETNPESIERQISNKEITTKYDSQQLIVQTSDGTEQTYDSDINEYHFEIQDELGNTICSTNDLLAVVEAYCIANVADEKAREKLVKKATS